MKRLLVLIVSFVLFSLPAYAYNVAVYGQDAVLGESVVLRSSKVNSGEKLVFDVLKPNGGHLAFPVYASSEGVAYLKLSSYHLRDVGNYKIAGRVFGDKKVSEINSFEIFSAEVDDLKSSLSPADQVVRNDGGPVFLTVKVLDRFGNPVPGREIGLKSNSGWDVIEPVNGNKSNSEGELQFKIRSSSVGVVTYEAYDLLTDRSIGNSADIVFYHSNDLLFAAVNSAFDFEYAAMGASAGALDHFEFEDLPNNVVTGEAITFTIGAYDGLDQSVLNYTGTVRFSAIGQNAAFVNLPDDYTFVPQDLGEHTFSLATIFQQPGTYEIEVRDLENTSVFTRKSIIVGQGSSSSSTPSSSSESGLTLQNPVAGTYSNNIQVISGTADPGTTVKIFDNDVAIATVIANNSGTFTYTTSPLLDGSHEIYAASVNEIGTIIDSTSPVIISIDTAAPEILNLSVDPTGTVAVDSVVKIQFSTNDDLAQAAMILNNDIYDFDLISPGLYEAIVSTPSEAGEYSVAFVLVDQLGNESRLDEQLVLKVEGVADEEVPSAFVGKVRSLVGIPANGRVTLNWLAPSESTNNIAYYRVFYGPLPTQLSEAVDTFTSATTWYIPNLQNGREFYFAVAAIDTFGNISDELSNLVSVTPNPVVIDVPPVDVQMGTGGSDAISEMDSDVSESGPDVTWLLGFSLLGGVIYNYFARRKISKV